MPVRILSVLLSTALLVACGPSTPSGGAVPSPAPQAGPSEPSPVPEPAPEPVPEPPPAPTAAAADNPARVVAVGDLHADLDDALAVLRMAGVVDEAGAWSGGETVLVQTGDTTDRGPDSKEVIELLMRLEGEAEAAGGQVVALLGNHEVMNLVGDLRYVSPGDVADFGSPEARAQAFSASGELGAWLRAHGVAAKVGDTVYVHGGITPTMARLGVDELNEAVASALATNPAHPVLRDEGPLWFRGYLQSDEAIACAEVAQALESLGARRMVMGHTTQRTGRVAVRCEGRILGIDTGISTHYGDHHAALELRDGDAWALYPSGPEDLPDPQVRNPG